MNIVISGCNGHIGSFLLRKLIKNKNIKNIYLFDYNIEKINNILNIKSKKNIFFFHEDLTKPRNLYTLKNIHCFIHLASITNAENSIKNKKLYFYNNLQSFKKVLKVCIKKKIKLIHISSTSIYGQNKNIVDEETKYIFPQSPYAKIKIEEEILLKKNSNKIKYVTLRFGTISGYSPGIRFHTAINKFCLQASLGEKITIWKTAFNQYRPYLTLNDAAKAIIFILNNNLFTNEVFNIVSENLRVKDIFKYIKKKIPSAKYKLTNSKIMNQLSYKVSSKKIKNQNLYLNDKISKSINQTLKKMNHIKNV